ncbi:hypothetical protein [Micromonospora sp. CPCC 205556]|uniref:hypothetical protein n=1 Tax=Micromonospora sp. CPCC 205556 TaxID=3122398 RepID=UPI002FF2C473
MPPDVPHRIPLRRLVAAGVLLAALPPAACAGPPGQSPAAPPGPPAPPWSTVSRPATAPPTTLPTGLLPTPPATPPVGFPPPGGPAPTPTPDPGLTVAPCADRPTADRVVALLRGKVLPRGVSVRASRGPLCAADWQYTVFAVRGHEELQVVTSGTPAALTLVTAGTDVCSVEVRAVAPPAIRTLACDDGTPARPGA